MVSHVDFGGIILLSKASILWPFVMVSVNSLETVIQKLAKDYFLFLLLNDKCFSFHGRMKRKGSLSLTPTLFYCNLPDVIKHEFFPN